MTSGFPISTGRLASSLNHERRRRRSKDDTDIGVDVATPEPRKANLRRSALTSNATEAQEISTLDNADLDTIICAVARVVYQYTVRNDSVRIGKSEAPSSTQQALDLFDEPQEPQWILYFARGITHERQQRWDEAEADFRKALDLRPGQPQVLNYLGYSMVEKQENLDEALGMIEREAAYAAALAALTALPGQAGTENHAQVGCLTPKPFKSKVCCKARARQRLFWHAPKSLIAVDRINCPTTVQVTQSASKALSAGIVKSEC